MQLTFKKVSQNFKKLTQQMNNLQLTEKIATKGFKMPHPARFNGKNNKLLEPFLTNCKAYFAFYAKNFNTNVKKVLFITTFIKGKIKQWFYPKLKNMVKGEAHAFGNTRRMFNSWEKFKKNIGNIYKQMDE